MVESTVNFTNLDTLNFARGAGLLPAVVQHAGSGAVLMLGYMNREALVATLARQRVVFFSRSKGRLWEKGETSGHTLELEEIRADCDVDTVLVRAWPRGPVCHLGLGSCFGETPPAENDPIAFLATLEAVIGDRIAKRPQKSYTAKLVSQGWKRIAQKVGEEGLETAIAGAGGRDDEVVQEVADLLYHVLVLLRARGLSLERVSNELRARHDARGAPCSSMR
jgi:phosphoribosyl-AMP cyclohydrolase / phosphoribosyl-ATP pyrophosphohydrolase